MSIWVHGLFSGNIFALGFVVIVSSKNHVLSVANSPQIESGKRNISSFSGSLVPLFSHASQVAVVINSLACNVRR